MKSKKKDRLILVIIAMLIVILFLVVALNQVNDKSRNTKDNTVDQNNSNGKIGLTLEQFLKVLEKQPMYITYEEYITQSDEYKSLYPDILSVQFINNSQYDIKSVKVAFLGWDSNNLPVYLDTNMFSSKLNNYLQYCNFEEANLIPGGVFNKKSGLKVETGSKVKFFKSIVKSFETYDGYNWENPYFDYWCEALEGKKYSDGITVWVKNDGNIDLELINNELGEVNKDSDGTFNSTSNNISNDITADEIDKAVESQDVRVISSKVIISDNDNKTLYPDALNAVIKNDSISNIKSITIAYAAWDKNNLPVKIKSNLSFIGSAYIKKVIYDNANFIHGESFGQDKLFYLDSDCKIETIKAIVYSYETYDGTIWTNPQFNNWCKLYEEKKLDN